MASMHIIDEYDDDTQIKKMLGNSLRRGDVIATNANGYRNSCVMGIWNGTKTVTLSSFPDDYGSVPREFEITDDNEFLPDHWHEVIDHNNYVWFSADIRKRIVDAIMLRKVGKWVKCPVYKVDIGGETWNFEHYFGSIGKGKGAATIANLIKNIQDDECSYAMTAMDTISIYT
jgi:hypothetical protein